MEEKTTVEILAEYTASLRLEDIPPEVVKKLKLCVGDALECCLSPVEDKRSRAAFASIAKDGPERSAALFATGRRASGEDAAFYNTVKGALTSRNDSSRTAICHPGSILIPVVFALAAERHLSGKQALEAILAGYEAMIRLGNALVQAKISGSWRNTSLVAPFGAAFAAAKAMELQEAQTAAAASFSCHFAGGINQWAVEGTGEDVFQNGWGARNGILAMRLAMSGAPGCRSILEGENGLLAALGARAQSRRLTEELGKTYMILDVMHKPIDSCFLVQGPCQAALALTQQAPELSWTAGELDRILIEVSGQAKAYPGCDNNREINSLVQGIMSIPLGVASTLVRKSCDGIAWAPPIPPEILAVMEKCLLIEDPDMTAVFPSRQGARITVIRKDSRKFTSCRPDVEPLTPPQVWQRFQSTAKARLGEEKSRRLTEAVSRLETLKDMGEILSLLA